jgi:tRNA(Ile)-lysidine synthetase-like protein
VGLSGGSDSVALTLILRGLSEHGGFTIAALAHLNHQLRPTASRDEQFCRDFAAHLALPIVVEAIGVKTYADAQRLSIEEAARRVRYDFLERAAATTGADRIAVGHTEDDQAETYLIKLIRGAGLAGLGGIYPRRGSVIRPLLDVSRGDLRAFLAAAGQPWVDDETNAELVNPRNRIRHAVIPELERAAGGNTRPAIARTAALAREDGEWLDEIAAARLTELITVFGGSTEQEPPVVGGSKEQDPPYVRVEFDADRLAAEPPPVLRRLLLAAMRRLAGGREVGLEHVEAAREVLSGVTAGVDIPGSRVELRGKKLVLLQQGGLSKW